MLLQFPSMTLYQVAKMKYLLRLAVPQTRNLCDSLVHNISYIALFMEAKFGLHVFVFVFCASVLDHNGIDFGDTCPWPTQNTQFQVTG